MTDEQSKRGEVDDFLFYIWGAFEREGIEFDSYQETHWHTDGYYFEARQPVHVTEVETHYEDGRTPDGRLGDWIGLINLESGEITPTGPILVRGIPLEPGMHGVPDLWPRNDAAVPFVVGPTQKVDHTG